LPLAAAASEPDFAAEALVQIDPAPEPAPVLLEAAAPPAPAVDAEQALQERGLVMIQTDPSKVKPIEPVAEVQLTPRPRPRRAPPPDTGPLQIVETRKDA
jgi:hypothetical protein